MVFPWDIDRGEQVTIVFKGLPKVMGPKGLLAGKTAPLPPGLLADDGMPVQ